MRNADSQALDRFTALLFALSDADQPLSAGRLAERTALPASSTYRLVGALERHGLVEREGSGIMLGLRILELARRIEERVERTLLEPAQPVMRELALEHRETVLLTAPVATCSIGLGSVESPRPIRLTYARWRLAPLHRGASGKVLLAFLGEELAEEVLAHAARSEPGLDIAALRRELATVRGRGYLITRGELDEGASGVAAPVLDRGGSLMAGLTIAGPNDRIESAETTLVDAVVRASRQIGARVDAVRRAPSS